MLCPSLAAKLNDLCWGPSEASNGVRGTGSAPGHWSSSDTNELSGGTARAGLPQSWNPNNSRLFYEKAVAPGGGFKTTVVAFLFMCDFSTLPGELGKLAESRSPEKSAAREKHGLGGFDLG